MKTNTKEYRRRFAAEVEGWLCREEGDKRSAADYLRGRFEAEAGWNIARVGRFAAMTEWLQGLPFCGMPYSYGPILEAYERLHGEPCPASKEDKILAGWFEHVAHMLIACGVVK